MIREENKETSPATGCEKIETKKPGAARFGNFINYYEFNPPQNRLSLLPCDLLSRVSATDSPVLALDVGCNAGNLTNSLYETFRPRHPGGLHILGVDLDQRLVERAEADRKSEDVRFCVLDLVAQDGSVEPTLARYLAQHAASKFNIVFLFSVTMWVHLNHGDEGLERLLEMVARYGNYILLEPQPWKCYQTAARRMRKLGVAGFPHLETISLRGEALEDGMLNLCRKLKMEVLETFGQTKWSRKLILLKTSS